MGSLQADPSLALNSAYPPKPPRPKRLDGAGRMI